MTDIAAPIARGEHARLVTVIQHPATSAPS